MRGSFAAILLSGITLVSCAPAAQTVSVPTAVQPQAYEPDVMCRGCHAEIYAQHSQSLHAKSFSNPLFQAQYFDEVLPRMRRDEGIQAEGKTCIACHSPLDYLTRSLLLKREQSDPARANVTCDFCHTVTGFRGQSPGNGNFISAPNQSVKLGPFKTSTTWHHAYHSLQTQSELCGTCHDYTNHLGVAVQSTYTEWKASRFASENVQCQDCHMSRCGYLVQGKSECEEGRAATMTLGEAPERSRLYTHRFPGAHSGTQISEGEGIYLEIMPSAETVAPGASFTVDVMVHNEKTGHKMPSGCADIRLLWLEFELGLGAATIFVPASPAVAGDSSDVAGGWAFDEEILGSDVPKGSRVYRTIFVDGTGKQTHASYDAVRLVYDNRLDTGELRKESYRVKLPAYARGTVELRARLRYLLYPTSLMKRYGQDGSKWFDVTSATALVHVR